MVTSTEEFWWPLPGAIDDLTVEETEGGFTLSAPDDTECAAWLQHWNATEERREVFQAEFETALTNFVNKH